MAVQESSCAVDDRVDDENCGPLLIQKLEVSFSIEKENKTKQL